MRDVHIALINVRGGSMNPLWDYLSWTNTAAQRLGTMISTADVNRLVHTRRYELLLSAFTNETLNAPIAGLLQLEMGEQDRNFEVAIAALEDQIARWTSRAIFVAPDTSFYIHHPAKLREINFQQVLHDAGLYTTLRGSDGEIHILIPDAVIDELDRLKESKDRHARWRAGHTLGVVDELFADPSAQPLLYQVKKEPWRNATVTMELLADPVGHVRLPESDDEIIDRLVGVKPLAARQVTVLTYDTGMCTRARRAGLGVVKPPRDFGPEST
ncbi:PIN domain-containing protein [Phytohabitans sp. ZYX-F-186]|uniref:PIN domain-containing protein n=1 Tax=Phytohabitans maris TaxID=3071409 RepID=A0ABU0ZEN3_9ACTN|nr:PIN domain-containing protein [Phytohabitans sp. ZYX-F-186]MDQ7905502.1 PIN domain-containing protein [Phytohabitans sp. ZYX-F-186]